MMNKELRVFPSEWDKRVNSVLLAYPESTMDWDYILEEVRDCYSNLIRAITVEADLNVVIITSDPIYLKTRLLNEGIPVDKVRICERVMNDTWARDFGPLTVVKNGKPVLLNFCFNGWGLKFASNYDNTINSFLDEQKLWKFPVENHLDFVLEGGSVESDGEGTIMTSDCLIQPNRNDMLSQKEIEKKLKSYFGVNKIIWLHHGYLEGDDTDGHIDTLVRFASVNSIVYCKCYNSDDPQKRELDLMEKELEDLRTEEGLPYRLFPVPVPDPIYDEDGQRLPATYANFLITPKIVLYPTYNQSVNDEMAKNMLEKAFPSHTIFGIDCRALIKQHGSLHCVTMQMLETIKELWIS